jgi:plastocyanin
MKTRKNSQSARSILLLACFTLLLGSFGCSKSSDNGYSSPPVTGGTRGTNEVWLQGMAFNPATLTVPVNTTVKWTNKDGYTHTVTSDSTMFDSGNLDSKATFSFTFVKKGSYKYHCNIHATMTGTIVVQ